MFKFVLNASEITRLMKPEIEIVTSERERDIIFFSHAVCGVCLFFFSFAFCVCVCVCSCVCWYESVEDKMTSLMLLLVRHRLPFSFFFFSETKSLIALEFTD